MSTPSTRTFNAQIRGIQRATDAAEATQRVTLEVPGEFSFKAGQYLLVHTPNHQQVPFSIASPPADLPTIELHIQPQLANAESQQVQLALQEGQLTTSAAQGEVVCPETSNTILVIAAGSGMSQANACALHRANSNKPTDILWCVANPDALYDVNPLHSSQWIELTTIVDPVVAADNKPMTWVRTNAKKYLNSPIIICGAPGFVYQVTDILLNLGFSQSSLHADAYQYAPR